MLVWSLQNFFMNIVSMEVWRNLLKKNLTGESLMYQESFAGGKDLDEVQFRSSTSPTSYSSRTLPVICGASFGKSSLNQKFNFILQKSF